MPDDIQTPQPPVTAAAAPQTPPPVVDVAAAQPGAEPAVAAQPSQPAPAAEAPTAINIRNPEGKIVSIPHQFLAQALDEGFQPVTDQEVHEHLTEEKYSTPAQQGIAAVEAAAQGVVGPIAPFVEHAAGVANADMRGRQEANPGIHALGQMGGLTASMLTGQGEAAIAAKLGEAGAAGLGLKATSFASKVGSAAVKAGIENAFIASADEASKMVMGDPHTSVQSAVMDVGLATLIGGGVGGMVGSVPALWQATMGGKTGGILKAVTNKMGGVEGALSQGDQAIQDALTKTGLLDTIAPDVRARLGSDPHIRELGSVLSQTDTNASGLTHQANEKAFREQVSKVQTEALGGEYGKVAGKGDLDRYTTGKEVGHALADEMDAQVKPLSEGYDAFYNRHKGIEIDPSIADKSAATVEAEAAALKEIKTRTRELEKSATRISSPEALEESRVALEKAHADLAEIQALKNAPGTVDTLIDKISSRAIQEGWTASGSSEIMAEVNRVIKELPHIKKLSDLSNYIKQVGENTASKLPFGQQTPVSRAGGIIKSILREHEGELLGKAIGSEEGVHALEQYNNLRKGYAAASQLKDQVSASLGLKASTTGFAKALRTMSAQDGETVLKRLLGKGDAAWLELAQRQFPKTAERIKQFHIQELLAQAKDGEGVSSAKLIAALDKMDPQMRKFVVSDEALGKIDASHSLLEHLNDETRNFSNTARTADKIMGGIPGAALGLATGILSHSPGAGLLVGALSKSLGKDAPDAVKLGILKFLGSSQKIESGGFKAMVDFIHAAQQGESRLVNATKAVFTAGREVLPLSAMPKEKDLERLDKKVKELKADPKPLLDVGGKTAHYLPEHGAAMGETASRVVNYLNSVRPSTDKKSPMDADRIPSQFEKSKYNNVLAIAQQPLVIMDKIGKGSLTSTDLVALKAMYPQLYTRYQTQIMHDMTDHMAKKGAAAIPYSTKMSLSLFLGQPLDSSMRPEAIMNAQPKPPEGQPGSPTMPKSGAKHSMAALDKVAGQYETAGQSRQQAKLDR